ncbi:MAG: tagaturonate reductase [Clostridiales bacterium]|jgi:tagaturonate reductase|nr:tagaturonate reductase [Clostridiales bacterium]
MHILNYKTLENIGYDGFLLKDAPERVIQFGEGNFLRAFADFFIDAANERSGFNAKVLVVQPIAEGLAETINKQDGLYTLYLRGVEDAAPIVRKRVISSISRCINPHTEYSALLDAAANPGLRFVISNTTEAGIVFDSACAFDDAPPRSFPAKLTRFLYERYNKGDKGLIIFPCELIDDNGAELKKCVEKYTELWGLDKGFSEWLNVECLFCPTLVDRIVTGYPRGEAERLNAENGYEDKLLDTGEVFGLWVIEGPSWLKDELPFEQAGLPVILTDDHKPYKQRKVRILNGAHTTMALAALLAGKKTVGECMADPVISGFVKKAVNEEIVPALETGTSGALPAAELETFAEAVFERFRNPYIEHSLLSISLNSVSKWRARVLPSVKAYIERFGKVPARLSFGFAALVEFYRKSLIKGEDCSVPAVSDTPEVLEFFKDYGHDLHAVCGAVNLWGEDLSALSGTDRLRFEDAVGGHLAAIGGKGIYDAIAN